MKSYYVWLDVQIFNYTQLWKTMDRLLESRMNGLITDLALRL